MRQNTDFKRLNLPVHWRELHLVRLDPHIVHILDFGLQPPSLSLIVIGHGASGAHTLAHELWIQACLFRSLFDDRVERGRPPRNTAPD